MRERHIIYGDYQQKTWQSLRGIEDPLVIEYIKRIKELNWGDYKLYLVGGILLEKETFDIDATILGERIPARINYLLDGVTRIGFELGIYPDIKWGTGLYDPTVDTHKEIEFAHYRASRLDDASYIKFASLNNGLYVRTKTFPMNKTLNTGYIYSAPMKLIG